MDNDNTLLDINEQMQIRIEKAQELENRGYEVWASKYSPTEHAQDILDNFEDFEGKPVCLAGRIMAMRGHGKATFVHVQDFTGKIQIYIRADQVGEQSYKDFVDCVDIGDIVGIEGEVFRTQKGEISVRAAKWEFLSKSLRPLPEKWHGLTDTETRYRQRYLDLISNPDVRATFVTRVNIIKAMRRWLDDRDFMEVETPMMHPIAGGAAARPFITHHNALDMQLYLRIAPELYLKRLVVGGFEKVYELNRNFRNEGISIKHNPEFSMIEIYQAYADYQDIMQLTEEMIADVAMQVTGGTTINYQETEIELKAPWRRLTMQDAVQEYANIDFSAIETLEQARELANEHEIEFGDNDGIGGILNLFFEKYCEHHLIQPTFIIGHPTEISPLAKANREQPERTDRFEAFVFGREIANGFSELNDPIDQKRRLVAQVANRDGGNDEAMMMDEDFVTALEYGLPPTGGLGIGVDRIVMFLTDSHSIRDVILFPHMRHKHTNA